MKKTILIFIICIVFSLCGVTSFAESGAGNSAEPQTEVSIDENNDSGDNEGTQLESIENSDIVQDKEETIENEMTEVSPKESEAESEPEINLQENDGDTSLGAGAAADIVANGAFPSNGDWMYPMDMIQWKLDSNGTMTVDYDGNLSCIPWLGNVPEQYMKATKKIVFGKKVTGLCEGGSQDFSNVTSVSFLSSSVVLEHMAFSGLPLKEITIPKSGITVRAEAFDGMKQLRKVTFNCPKIDFEGRPLGDFAGDTTIVFGPNVSRISSRAFQGTQNVRSAIFMGDCDYNDSVFENADNLNIYRKDGNGLKLEEHIGTEKKIVVPSSANGQAVTKIGAYAFEGKNRITRVSLPKTIKAIDKYAFYGCSRLENVGLQNGLKSIGPFAFYGCNSMTSLKLPATLTSIGERAFWNCYSLKTLAIPGSVQTINQNAFESCTGLTTLTVGSNTTAEVLRNVFVDEVYAASSTGLKINPYAFKNCKNLKKVTLGPKVKSVGTGAFYNCSKITTLTIGKNVTSIGASAFYGCTNLTSLSLPKSVTSIGGSAFYNCNKMASLTIGENVTSIGTKAFAYCKGIKKVTLGKKVKSIGAQAFFNCSKLKTITIKTKLLKKSNVGSKAFKGIHKKATFKVPKKKFKAYKKMLKKRGATKKMKFKKIKKL